MHLKVGGTDSDLPSSLAIRILRVWTAGSVGSEGRSSSGGAGLEQIRREVGFSSLQMCVVGTLRQPA